eukprot:16373875-Heterocapsa_arctica.AAC.1
MRGLTAVCRERVTSCAQGFPVLSGVERPALGPQASQVLKRQSRQGCVQSRCSGRCELQIVELIAVV